MARVSMRHLRYFHALAEHRHFGHAAEACAISQPALSLQIKELEQALGATLVERGNRQTRLTGLGVEIAERVLSILAAVDELEDVARAHGGALSGPFPLGLIPTVAPYLLPQIVRRLAASHPGLELHPREAVTQTLLDGVGQGGLDAAILALPLDDPGLTARPLFEEEFVLLRPAADGGRPVPEAKDLATMRLLLLEEGHCFRDQALSYCDLASVSPGRHLEASSLSTLVQMVGAGMGVTLIPEMAISLETRSANVSVARLPAPVATRQIGLVWRRTSPFGPQMEQISEVLADLGPR
ncbi:hydrogen peroxide-inducible genes activator [Litorisediminicola beolgyonensis]|uniref:LysR substrate-binding domain-containing protein n=1 Tax=Litorisediminicola beolgyonensis TaxID=1173614 RepID=A0ABW3ZGZ5_9RHOB